MRLVQYWSRFFWFYLYRKGYEKSTYETWKTLQVRLAVGRKLFRIGKPLGLYKAAAQRFDNKTLDPVVRTTDIIRNLGFAGFFTLDHLVWLHSSGVRQFDKSTFTRIQRASFKLWFIGLAGGIINGAYRYQRARRAVSALKTDKEKDAAAIKRAQLEAKDGFLRLVWDSLDILIPATGLGYLNLDDGIVGIAGLITSYLGVQALW
jgi:peroxin-11B